MKTEVYLVANDIEHINELGAAGWKVLSQNPLVVGIEFRIAKESPILQQFVKLFEGAANESASKRRELNSVGIWFKRIYSDKEARKVYAVDWPRSERALCGWRLEFPTTLNPKEDGDVYLGLTFGHPRLNVPCFCDAEVIDRYVPTEIIDHALANGCVTRKEVVREDA